MLPFGKTFISRPDSKVIDMKPVIILVALVAIFAISLWNRHQASAGALDYRSDWGATLEEARDSGKPILINYGGPW